MRRELYSLLAELLSYPESGYLEACGRAPSQQSASTGELSRFLDAIRPLSLHDLQELFIRTFDLSPICSLEMGWHLFGENYDRGLLLVKMRQLLRTHGIAEGTELPDHLTYALRLLPSMEREDGAYFAEAIVLPSVEKMLAALRGKENPYEDVLSALRTAVRTDFPGIGTAPPSEATTPLPVLA